MIKHGGDVLVEMLIAYGVPVVFGLAGGQTLPLYDGIRSRSSQIRHIPMRDERSAAYAADGYARISGQVGVCDATVGPGSIKFVSGLAEALNSSVPIVALISDMSSEWLAVRYRGGGNQLVDQLAVLAPLCKWTGRLPASHKMPELVGRAFQMATTGRPGPVAIEMPEDLFRAGYDGPDPAVATHFGTIPPFRSAPDLDAVGAAADLLSAAKNPVVIAGGGVWLSQAREKLTELVERLKLPVVYSMSGKGALPENHPLAVGMLGALGGSPAARQLVEEADVILAVGYKFGQNPTFLWTLPGPAQKIIHLDIDGSEIGKLFPTAVGLVGDARAGLSALLSACGERRSRNSVVEKVARLKAERKTNLENEAAAATPIKPQQVAAAINEVAGSEAILVCDASFSSGWGAMYFEITENRRALFPRGMAGLGWALPAAIGAQVARPDAQVIVLAGDGAMTYCLGELATLAQEGLPVKVIVLNNSTMGWIKWDQALAWDGRFHSTDLSSVDFAKAAVGLGCAGLAVNDPADLNAAISQALAIDGPVVVDVRTTANEAAATKFVNSDSARAHMSRATAS